MMINTQFYHRCVDALDSALNKLNESEKNSTAYDIYRSAVIKEFEVIIEQSGKLMKKCLQPYMSSKRATDRLAFKDVFRQAAKHDLISLEESERWMGYRDNRNETAHDYGFRLAEKTLPLLPQFIQDARDLTKIFENCHDN